MRAFIAIELPTRIKDILFRTCLELEDRIAPSKSIRWVRQENIHLTLRFLGEMQPELVSQIGHAIDLEVSHLPVFDLELNELGCFPNLIKPRTIWVGIAGQTGLLQQLYKIVEQELMCFRWQPEGRPFQPHITIGRVKSPTTSIKVNLPFGRKVESLSFSVTAVSLIESVLRPEGASHTMRYSCPLGAAR